MDIQADTSCRVGKGDIVVPVILPNFIRLPKYLV
nr:MAG TPA: hypothetical protein [Caudoviricetes sp.]